MTLRCFLYIGVFAGLLSGCERRFAPTDEAAIRSVMDQQEMAWNKGDIPAFMEGYAEDACFISRKGRTCGRAEVTDHYLTSYPDKAAMGKLTFAQLEVLGAGPDHAWCTGTWQLERVQDTLSGGFSLFWEHTAQGWRILRDHTY